MTEKMLLVDDDELFVSVLKPALERRGYDVYTAYGAAQAFEVAQRHRFDKAVVDLRIGEDSGLNLVQELHELSVHTQIVMLTGYASIATAVEAIKLGALHYLTKPADADEILDAFTRGEGDTSVEPAEHPPSPRRLEWEHLQKVLNDHNGNISATARALGMHRRTLQRKLQKHPVRR